jgi:cytochrome c biogenesis protein CcmG, thiol:disulfide interchange protein DsbE
MRIAAMALLCVVLLFSSFSAQATDKAPDFTLKNLKGKNVKLSDVYKDGPVLLTFWSTWCKNCPEEMNHFQRFYNEYKDQGLTVLALSIDQSKTLSKVKPWVKGRRLDYPVLLDTKNKVKKLYHVSPVPHSFVINTKGEIVYSHVGYRPGDEKAYEAAIKKLLTATEKK